MPENQTVGATTDAGATGTPNPPVSTPAQPPIQGDASQLFSALESNLTKQITDLQKELRGLQGRQDKQANDFQQQLARFNQIKTQGNLSDEQALTVMSQADTDAQWRGNIEKTLADIAGRIAGAGTPANGQQQTVAGVFSQIGLDLTDPRVAVAMTKTYKDAEAIELAAYRLQREVSASPQPNPAQNASLTGTQKPAAANLDQLYADYERAAKTASQNKPLMENLLQQIKAAGG